MGLRLNWRLALGIGLLAACIGIPLIQLLVAVAAYKGWATVLKEFSLFMLWGLALSAGVCFLMGGICRRAGSPK